MARLLSKLQNDFYVEQYGAKADGATDDTTAIQNCINACYIAGGGNVHLRRGIHVVSATIILKHRVKLIGRGEESTTIRQMTAGLNIINIRKVAGDLLDSFNTIKHMTLEGVGQSTGATAHGVYFEGDFTFAQIVFESVKVNKVTGNGFCMDSVTYPNQYIVTSNFINTRSHECGKDAYYLDKATSVNFSACYAGYCLQAGFHILGSSYIQLNSPASEHNGINYQFESCQSLVCDAMGSEFASDYSLTTYTGIHLLSKNNTTNVYDGFYALGFVAGGASSPDKGFMIFDGDINTQITGVVLKYYLPVNYPGNFTYEIKNGAIVSLKSLSTTQWTTLPKKGFGEFTNIENSDLHNLTKGTAVFSSVEMVDNQVLSADLTLSSDGNGVYHLNGGGSVRNIILPTTNIQHAKRFKILNWGLDTLTVRETSNVGTVRGTLAFGEWAEYKYDINVPQYYEWKVGSGTASSNYVGATALLPGVAGLVNPASAGEQAYIYTGGGTWENIGSDYKTLWQATAYQGVFVNEAVGVFNSPDLYTENYTNNNAYPVLVELEAFYQMNLIYATPTGVPNAFDARILTYTTGTTNRWGGNLYQFNQIDDDGRVQPIGESLNKDYVLRGLSDCIVVPGASCTFTAQLNINGGPGIFNTQARALYGSLTVTRLRSALTI